MYVSELEAKIKKIEGITLIIRAPMHAVVPTTYPFRVKFDENKTIYDYLNTRLKSLRGNFEVVIIHGDYSNADDLSMSMKKLRESYNFKD